MPKTDVTDLDIPTDDLDLTEMDADDVGDQGGDDTNHDEPTDD